MYPRNQRYAIFKPTSSAVCRKDDKPYRCWISTILNSTTGLMLGLPLSLLYNRSTISITLRSIFPRSSISFTTSILSHLNEKTQLSLDFFDKLRGGFSPSIKSYAVVESETSLYNELKLSESAVYQYCSPLLINDTHKERRSHSKCSSICVSL